MKTQTKDLLLIFTRNPELGKVKTRLAKGIGSKAALDIYNYLLQHTFQVTKDLDVCKEVYYSEEIWENDLWDPALYEKKLQKGKDLGLRMENAVENAFERGFEKVVIIGSDLLDLESKDIDDAFIKLDSSDYVIGPAQDGGYYLCGMKKLNGRIFRNKNWGTNSVLKDTMEDLESQNVSLLEVRNDIDTLEDLKEFEELQHFIKQNNN